MPLSTLSIDDQTYIAERLGQEASGVTVLGVASRDAQGRPAVITNHPLRRASGVGDVQVFPFPTMYWLIDPVCCKRMADLERDGAVGALERAIAGEGALREAVHADHRRYAAARWALLTEAEQRRAIDAGYGETLRDKGIGGIADFDRIKCLHLQMAYHLAEQAAGRDGTTVGRLIESGFTPQAPGR
ncbi:MAG: DUF501 domain-containing protein [Phycisphaerales bacterium JB063]